MQNPKNTDEIIAEVFRLTGIRVTADDPVMAILLMQRQYFDTAVAEIKEHQATFTGEINTHAENIAEAAGKLEAYRQQLLVELA